MIGEKNDSKQFWDVPKAAFLSVGGIERPVYPLGISPEGEMYLSENPLNIEPLQGKWSKALLVKTYKEVVLVELTHDRAVFRY